MAQQSLYRRYRPRRFGEIRGQDHVVRALRNAVATGTEGHAYLFSGPRGTGKTSTARILAKALNCDDLTDGEPCCECEPCVAMEAGRSFDLFELDAASNNGVEAVRELIERTAVGSPGRTKVYILDEVHMLTAAASNALLKTLEEPPDHVRFVLATTDPQKVLPTIRSRTQHFEFQLLSAAELESYVRWIVSDAGLDVSDDAVAHVVRQGRGSARDTLSALDQVVAAGGVLVRSEPVDRLFAGLASSDPGAAIAAVAEALAEGHDPRVLADAFLTELRDAFLISLGVDVAHLVDSDSARLGEWAGRIGTAGLTRAMERIGGALVDMRQAADPRVPLEVALVQLCTAETPPSAVAVAPAGASPAGAAPAGASPAGAAPAGASPAGAAAAPAGAAPPAEPSAASPAAERPTSTDRPTPAAQEPAPSGAAEHPGPTRPASGPGAEARAALSAVAAKRSSADQSAPARQSSSRPSAPPQPPRRGTAAATPAAATPAAATPAPATPAPAPATPAPATPAAAPPVATGVSGVGPSRDEVTMAFGDVVAPQLKGIGKAVWGAARFVDGPDGPVAVFDNQPTLERAEGHRGEVERLLTAHFGSPVRLRTTTEADAAHLRPASAAPGAPSAAAPPAAASPAAASPATAPAPAPAAPITRAAPTPAPRREEAAAEDPTVGDPGADDDLPIDLAEIDELEDATDAALSGVDRVVQAFPGAVLVEQEGEPS